VVKYLNVLLKNQFVEYNRIIGKILNKHKVEELLGAGGFSYAFKVKNIIDNQIKVFKILREDQFGKVWQRSVHEGRVLEDLADIEGVPDFYHSKIFDRHSIRSHYLALEYIPGISLQDMIDSGYSKQLSEREKIKMLYELALTINSIHQKGIIHRDIKPSNVVVSTIQEGRNRFYDVHLIDFFLANYLNKSKNPPKIYKDRFFGTQGFIAPESMLTEEDQIKFEKEENEKTDIFAFGTTSFALIQDIANREEIETQTNLLQQFHNGERKNSLVSPSNYLSVFKKLFIGTTKYQQEERSAMPEVIPELERLIEKKWLYWRYKRFTSLLRKKRKKKRK